MSAAHQRFSAATRRSGELDKPEGGRRRNLDTGRLSVVFGADPACVLEHEASQDQRSVGGLVRKIVLEWFLEKKGMDAPALSARAAELRAAKASQTDEDASPAPATPAAV